MGSIRKLKDTCNVHLLLTSSNLAEIYVYDTLKEKCNGNIDTIYTVNSRSTFTEMLDLVNVQSFEASKWLFVIDYSRVKTLLKGKKAIFDCNTSEFLIKVKNYKEFKELKRDVNCNDIYLNYMNYSDICFLLDKYKLGSNLVKFICNSYSSDSDKIFTLQKNLSEGYVVSNKKDITNICGNPVGSLVGFALIILRGLPKTDRGYKMALKRRIKLCLELGEVYGSSSFKNFLISAVKDILDIKQLYLVGAIYDDISNLPSCFDEGRLKRYSKYLNTIKTIEYPVILKLYLELKKSNRWYSSLDTANFIYNYSIGGE